MDITVTVQKRTKQRSNILAQKSMVNRPDESILPLELKITIFFRCFSKN